MRDWLDKANLAQQEVVPPQSPESEGGGNVPNINELDEFSAAINAFLEVSNDEELQLGRVGKSEALPIISSHHSLPH